MSARTPRQPREKLTRYQRFVVIAAWLGFGFDIMEGVLLSFVAPIAVPDLLDLPANAPGNRAAITYWTGVLTSIGLLGWAVGGLAFGWLSDRIGRARTVVLTILIYSIGTAAAGFAPNIYGLAVFRFIGAIGIGGEFAAGVSLVAETVPENRRVSMGTLLTSAGIAGGLLAVFTSRLVMTEIDALAARPDLAWRLVMCVGIAPAILAVFFRNGLHESDRWTAAAKQGRTGGKIRDLVAPSLRARVVGGAVIATLILMTIWSVSTFMPQLAGFLADEVSGDPGSPAGAALRASYVLKSQLFANAGILIGMLAAAPIAERFGRRPLFVLGFGLTALMIVIAFGLDWSPMNRMILIAAINIPLGVASSALNFYLTELFPLALRGSGVSMCMNVGRFLMALGPMLVGLTSRRGVPVLEIMTWTAIVPALGCLLVLAGVGVETKGQPLDAAPGERDHGALRPRR